MSDIENIVTQEVPGDLVENKKLHKIDWAAEEAARVLLSTQRLERGKRLGAGPSGILRRSKKMNTIKKGINHASNVVARAIKNQGKERSVSKK